MTMIPMMITIARVEFSKQRNSRETHFPDFQPECTGECTRFFLYDEDDDSDAEADKDDDDNDVEDAYR